MYQIAETLKINANYMCVYDTFLDDGTAQRFLRPGRAVNFFDNFHDCQMSAGAVKTVRKCVNTILYLAHRYHTKKNYVKKAQKVGCTSFRAKAKYNPDYLCTFITLTLQSKQQHTDDELVRFLLNPFLVYARKYFGVKYYVWKKELQRNGNIHFHLVTDKFIDHKALRATWNRLANRGAVPGCKTPFKYVDNYTAQMRARFANGFNMQDQKKIFSKDYETRCKIAKAVADAEKKQGRQLTALESKMIASQIISEAVLSYKKYIDSELRKPVAEQFTNPNSTDISAVKNGRMVSAYVGKYIAKDIADNNKPLSRYIAFTEHIKNKIYALMKLAEWKKANGYDYSKEASKIEFLKNKLCRFREKRCLIKGALWYKSRTLTPFMSGASVFVDQYINEELKKVLDYLMDEQQKSGRQLILQDDDRHTITLLLQASELKRLRLWALFKLYDDFIVKGILQNINNAAKRSEARRLRNQNKVA